MKRKALAAVAALGLMAAAGCGSSGDGSGSGDSIVWVDGGGAFHEAIDQGVLQPYASENDVDIVSEAGTDNAKLRAMVEADRVTWDVYNGDNTWGTEADSDYLEPLDYSVIPEDEILDGYASKYRVANTIYSIQLAWNTDKVSGTPQGWADFFDTETYPGKRAVMDYSVGGIVEIALLADGVAPEDLYPLDLDRAIAKLDTIKDDLVFWTSGAESEDLVGSGEVAMVMTYNARAYDVKNELGKPVDYTFRDQILAASYLSVPKGTKNKDAAMELIAYAVGADANGKPSQYLPLAPSNTAATPDAAMEKDLPTAHLDEPHAEFDDVWIAENSADVEAAYQKWRSTL
ncbi:extracellular solute-binding protein [Nocardioides hwasunensis]|uniref:Extracellular solute-binding protein n=1 Tax=Nocardioides hwasunensis TaxID=397258 RepID=A0ABR8MK93_9ACTN|nr:extracellular solute-binding protein [Nocardioides hwasunensis]MBD3916452.1 extracellular solute-binding protein [Nocardioides hwasunensis]